MGGKDVKVLIGGTPKGLKVRAEKCWSTPGDESHKDKLSYTLIDKSCAVDNTVSTTSYGDSGKDQLISFKLFTFTKIPKSHIMISFPFSTGMFPFEKFPFF